MEEIPDWGRPAVASPIQGKIVAAHSLLDYKCYIFTGTSFEN